MRPRWPTFAILLAALAALATPAHAQAPASPVTVLPAAETSRYPKVHEALARADTARALQLLQGYGLRGDAEAWSRRAALATQRLPYPWRRPKLINDGVADAGTWLVVEESLLAAVRAAPDSARYWMALARHRLRFRSGAAHHAGYENLDSVLAISGRTGGADGWAIAAYEAAMLFWREWQQYDGRPEGSLEDWEKDAIAADASAGYPTVRHFRIATVDRPRLGARDLDQATLLLAAAADSAPLVQPLRRRHYAALAIVEAWEELRVAAARRAGGRYGDFVDLLALGLAHDRLGQPERAESTFLAARAAMPLPERNRLTSIAGILPDREAIGFEAMLGGDRDRAEERAWLLLDPLWRTPGNELRSEFMARVAYAELRWGDGGYESGIGSDPGAAWLAYGPPAVAYTQARFGTAGTGSSLMLWRWSRTAMLQYLLAPDQVDPHLRPGVRARLDSIVAREGIAWRNVPGALGLDSIAVQSAMFRAGRDSADLFFAARVPTDRLSRGLPAGGSLALDLWIRTPDGALVRHDASTWEIDAPLRRAGAIRAWRHRLPPSHYIHRVEAGDPQQGRAARGASLPASLDDASFRLGGFGVSQVLVTEGVATRRGAATADRWSDYNIRPNPGDLHRDRPVSLLWEIYGDSATALDRYRVQVTLQPPAASAASPLAAQATTGVIGTTVRRTRSKDRVTVTYLREHALPAGVRVEQVDLGAVKVKPGLYVLRVDVVDVLTGRTATTSRLVDVR